MDNPRLQDLLSTYHGVLGIYITMRCPLACAHCGVDSGPWRWECIDDGLVLRQIEAVAHRGTVKTLHLNGGEPFLELGLLRAICSKASELGLGVAITTSANWASSPARASDILADLSGLTQLMISADHYHLPFVRLLNIRHAVEASLRRGIRAQIGICTAPGAGVGVQSEVERILGPELLAHAEIGQFPLEAVGRANLLSEAHWRPMVADFPTGACRQVNRPVLTTDGTVLACCNVGVSGKVGAHPLRIGNCVTEDADCALARADRSFYIQALRIGGPAMLAQIAIRGGYTDGFRRRYRSGDICDLCEEILASPELQTCIERALATSEIRSEIAALRSLLFQEPHMLNECNRT